MLSPLVSMTAKAGGYWEAKYSDHNSALELKYFLI